MSSDPAVVADEVRAQVTEVALICNRILATTGPFAHPHAIRNDLMSAIIALELADLQCCFREFDGQPSRARAAVSSPPVAYGAVAAVSRADRQRAALSRTRRGQAAARKLDPVQGVSRLDRPAIERLNELRVIPEAPVTRR
jgi:hypothetical protein